MNSLNSSTDFVSAQWWVSFNFWQYNTEIFSFHYLVVVYHSFVSHLYIIALYIVNFTLFYNELHWHIVASLLAYWYHTVVLVTVMLTLLFLFWCHLGIYLSYNWILTNIVNIYHKNTIHNTKPSGKPSLPLCQSDSSKFISYYSTSESQFTNLYRCFPAIPSFYFIDESLMGNNIKSFLEL